VREREQDHGHSPARDPRGEAARHPLPADQRDGKRSAEDAACPERRAQQADAGLAEAVTLDSSGTGDWHVGQQMYPQARRALARRGYDGSTHRARQFRASWFPDRDLILAMDAGNLAALRRMAGPEDRDRIRLFGEVGGLGEIGGGEIPDPYGGNEGDFAYVLDLLGAAAPVIAAGLAELLGHSGTPA